MYYTDDPIADFKRHDAERQKELDKLPVCCKCDEPIQDDHLFAIYGDLYCEECMEEIFKQPIENYIEEV